MKQRFVRGAKGKRRPALECRLDSAVQNRALLRLGENALLSELCTCLDSVRGQASTKFGKPKKVTRVHHNKKFVIPYRFFFF